MIAAGTVVEVGQLEGEGGEHGFVIERPAGGFITVKGLTEDEARAAAKLFLEAVTVTLAPAKGTPP